MIHFSEGAIRWLETILFERFGHRFILAEQPNTLQFYLNDSQGSITFPSLQGIFHQSRSDFPCQQWQASSEDFIAPIEDNIPAPFLNALP
ncbi:hypothetical protein EAY73_19780, partial [Vibrio anguillarum]|nr:hypothetical protein [Vibrio anguillarum]